VLSFKNYKTFLNEKNIKIMFEVDLQNMRKTEEKFGRLADKKSGN